MSVMQFARAFLAVCALAAASAAAGCAIDDGAGGGSGGIGGEAGVGGSGGMGGDAGTGGEAGTGGTGGSPEPQALYEQNFESLDPGDSNALAGDGWRYLGFVFEADGSLKFPVGPFPAPTTSDQISLIATGQGGATQGAQQLLVFSNYDCCDPPNQGHFDETERVTTLVYQEFSSIPAALIGSTVRFSFDAKRGNVAGDTTGAAYIQTLDPETEFARTSVAFFDTTSLPETWARYTLSLELASPILEGQLLQFGFENTASNFEGSANFYDNIEFTSSDGQGRVEPRPLPEIYKTGKAIAYSAFRAAGPPFEVPTDAEVLEDLALLNTAGFDLLRLFGADAVSEKILRLAAENYPEMRFQQGVFLEGVTPSCQSELNDSQIDTAIRLAETYSNVATVSVGNETTFSSPSVPLTCLANYVARTRENVTQPVTANQDYTFYANFFGGSPDGILRLVDFVAIHMYPFLNYEFWDWQQLSAPAGPLRAEAMMNAALAKAQSNYQAVRNYRYLDATGRSVTIGESVPIVIGETGWKWRQTSPTQVIESYAALEPNAKWYYDLMRDWERSEDGPLTIFIFEAFDEAWKGTDDGWGLWDQFRAPLYQLCDTPAGSSCNDPVDQGAGFFTP